MTKTKAQLRAEAVERLKDTHIDTGSAVKKLAAAIGSEWNPPSVNYSLGCLKSKLIDLLTDDAHESRGSYEERLYDVPVSDCPYCGCERVVIHDFNDIYEKPHSYRVEHIDEKEAFNAGCFESYLAFDSVEKAVEHANMRDLLIDDEPQDEQDSREKLKAADRMLSLLTGKERVFPDDEPQEQDTREKLEHDCKWMAYAWAPAEFPYDKFYREIIEKLDRQAAITERECADRYVNTWTEGSVAWILRQYEDEKLMRDVDCEAKVALETEELQAKVDALEAENAEIKSRHCPHYHVKEHYCDVHETRIAELLAKVDALEAELVVVDWWTDEHGDTHAIAANGEEVCHYVKGEHAEAVNKMIMELEAENEKLKEELRLINTYSGVKGCECETTVFGMKLDEVRGLKAENAELREKLDAYETREAEEADELLTKYENLKKRVVELEADNTKWVAENITLRANLSKALDHAHAIGKLGEI